MTTETCKKHGHSFGAWMVYNEHVPSLFCYWRECQRVNCDAFEETEDLVARGEVKQGNRERDIL